MLSAFAIAGTANATPYVDVVDEGIAGPTPAYLSAPSSFGGTFNIISPGSDDATGQIGLADFGRV